MKLNKDQLYVLKLLRMVQNLKKDHFELNNLKKL